LTSDHFDVRTCDAGASSTEYALVAAAIAALVVAVVAAFGVALKDSLAGSCDTLAGQIGGVSAGCSAER